MLSQSFLRAGNKQEAESLWHAGLVLGGNGSGWSRGVSGWGCGAELAGPWDLVAQRIWDITFPTDPSRVVGKRVKKPGEKVQTCGEWFLQPPERGRASLGLPLPGPGKTFWMFRVWCLQAPGGAAEPLTLRRKTRGLGPERKGDVELNAHVPWTVARVEVEEDSSPPLVMPPKSIELTSSPCPPAGVNLLGYSGRPL